MVILIFSFSLFRLLFDRPIPSYAYHPSSEIFSVTDWDTDVYAEPGIVIGALENPES